MEYKEIKLTKNQKIQLTSLQQAVEEVWKDGKPGAIIAQVYPDTGVIKCTFLANIDAKKLNEAWEIFFSVYNDYFGQKEEG